MTAQTSPRIVLTSGPLYPDHCIDCPVLLRETYGSVAPLWCMKCTAADRAVRELIHEMILKRLTLARPMSF